MNTKKIIFGIVIVVLVAVFGVSAFMVGNYMLESKQVQDRYDQLAAVTEAPTEAPATKPTKPAKPSETTTPSTEPVGPTGPVVSEKLQKAKEQNADTVGYMWIENTKIDYPVVQTPGDPNFYLYKDFFTKKDSKHGAIYAWGDADVEEPSDNITIFGHNMADGSMFAGLNPYVRKETWENNPWIFYSDFTGDHLYKIIAVFKTSANIGEGFSYHKFVDAKDEKEFNEYVKTCKDLAFYDTGETAVYGDKLISLSTCEYTLDNGRLVVVAKRVS